MKKFKTFEEFWPFYLSEHKKPLNKILHFSGTMVVHLMLIAMLITGDWQIVWLLPIIGYGFSWVGHFFVEKNKPATFQYPWWSLLSDFKMFYLLLFRKINWNT